MPPPKHINNPAVRAAWLASRRATVQAFDQLVSAGTTRPEAARQLRVTVPGIHSMRQSVESLQDGRRAGRGSAKQIDLGLALLSCLLRPGEELTCQDIAAWCGCTKSAIQRLEHRAMRKVRQRLMESAGDPEFGADIRRLFSRSNHAF